MPRFVNRQMLVLAIGIVSFTGLYKTFYNEPVPQPITVLLQEQATNCCSIATEMECNPRECEWCMAASNNSENLGYTESKTRVYFHETSGASTLDWRQACSVESAARKNPSLKIQVYMVTSTINYSSPQLATLREYTNVNIEPLDLATHFKDTPFEPWLFCSRWKTGPYAISHLRDALRYLTLWKFGGYYFDLGVLFLKSVEKLRNFAALQNPPSVGAGAIHLRHRHPIIKKIAARFVTSYKLREFAENGPGIFNRVLVDVCGQRPQDIRNCAGFRVLPPNTFYPIPWQYWFYFTDVRRSATVNRLSKNSYAVHVWNKVSKNVSLDVTSDQPYSRLAREACPKIVKLARFW